MCAAGGVFHLRLRFNAEFNSTPPTVQFMTIPFHPNSESLTRPCPLDLACWTTTHSDINILFLHAVDPSDGTPCCHLLSAGWTEDTSIPALLIALQVSHVTSVT